MSKTIANPINDLREIRALMERSRYFIGLSGLSGIGAGIFALLGVAMTIAYQRAADQSVVFILRSALRNTIDHPWGVSPLVFLFLNGVAVLSGALFCGYYFTRRRAERHGQSLHEKKTYTLLFHLAVPLVVGGIFCLGLIFHQQGALIAPATLIFYGLALINGSRYAREEFGSLGYMEAGLGLIACFFPGYGLYFWAVGFGLFHILYGIWMYRKYESS